MPRDISAPIIEDEIFIILAVIQAKSIAENQDTVDVGRLARLIFLIADLGHGRHFRPENFA